MTEPRDWLQLVDRCARWPLALPDATPEQLRRFARATLKGGHWRERRVGGDLVAAVARMDLPWDTAKLGEKAGRLALLIPPEAASAAPELIASALDDARRDGCRYLVARVDSGDIAGAQQLEAAGFQLVDAILSLQLLVAQAPALARSTDLVVAAAEPADGEALAALSDRALSQSRFHCDPHIGPERGKALYRKWLIDGVNGQSELTLLARDARTGRLAGFLSCKTWGATQEAFDVGYCRIELVAVDEPYRGRGVVRELTASLLAACPARNWQLVGIGTQISNARAIRAYLRVGFTPADSVFTFRWRAG